MIDTIVVYVQHSMRYFSLVCTWLSSSREDIFSNTIVYSKVGRRPVRAVEPGQDIAAPGRLWRPHRPQIQEPIVIAIYCLLILHDTARLYSK